MTLLYNTPLLIVDHLINCYLTRRMRLPVRQLPQFSSRYEGDYFEARLYELKTMLELDIDCKSEEETLP